ncbi:hypothetical protein H310_10153 [Aphanomyces invadans]|uniref:Rhodanese domain-containing protein n=1 Tax=Aphanomyces invadans TaxID=157072 RepID=A0A024TRW4_9STRA|nr:hypothetical protein H310_10153 [Aphanomyces invadans]ETV96875.1 hypothetical protein H310_10153 [Aphanomyces invadans]|eukprot:XP_008874652.1 hypothetical protein H310_10153 [Aphanomyces invadans]
MTMLDAPLEVVLYYRYVHISDVGALIASQEHLCQALGLQGRVRISEEGINGTLGGAPASIQGYVDAMESSPEFSGLNIDWKRSDGMGTMPFHDLLVRRVKEIVSIELPDEACNVANTGIHLSPEDFHAALQDATPSTTAIIDVRNNYEYNIGHFHSALNPSTRRFGQFPHWVRDNLDDLSTKNRILMYCTGGIRCEKASAYLKHLGLSNVYQLKGGIHRYLEAFPDGGAFLGKNFVFDHRVAVASSNDAVVGRCESCGSAHDDITGIRCSYCRMHVMLCSACGEQPSSKAATRVFCSEHKWLGEGNAAELTAKIAALERQLKEHAGPNGKGRRRSIRKQVDAIEETLAGLQQRSRPWTTLT